MPHALALGRLILVLTMLIAGVVHAGPVDDLIRGDHLLLTSATVQHEHPYNIRDHVLPKAAGSLDMTLSARAFGFDSDLVIHLYGTRSGDRVTWTFNEWLPQPYDLGWFNAVVRVDGALVADVEPLPSSDDMSCTGLYCTYSVRLRHAPGSRLRAHVRDAFGNVNPTDIGVLSFDALAGLSRPRLSGFTVHRPRRLCSSSQPRTLQAEVFLPGSALAGGTWVDVRSSSPAQVSVGGVRVPEFATSQRVTLTIAPHFEGSVGLTARSGGERRDTLLEVKPASECTIPLQAVLNLAAVLDCHTCIQPSRLVDGGTVLGRWKDGQAVIISPKGEVTRVVDLFDGKATWVDGTALNNHGQLAGVLKLPDGTEAGFFRDGLGKDARYVTWKGVRPLGLGDGGTVVGQRLGAQGVQEAVVFNGQKLLPLLPKVTGSSTAVAVNSAGQVVGMVDTGKGPRAFFYDRETVTELGDLGGGQSEVTALNEAGQMVGSARTADGTWRAFFHAGGKSGMKDLGTLPGMKTSRAVDLNEAGWAVGTATNGQDSRGFLYTPTNGLLDLTALLPKELNPKVLEAVAVNDSNQVLVRAWVKGVLGWFLLTVE